MGRNGRAAGRRFEQTIARDLRSWLGEGWKVSRNQSDRQQGQSGGTWGEFQIEGPTHWPFTIECKNQATFHEYQLWTDTGPLQGFWDQAVEQAEGAGNEPMLIVKAVRTRSPVLVLVRRYILRPDPPGMEIMLSEPDCPQRKVAVVRWEDMLQRMEPGELILAAIPLKRRSPLKMPPLPVFGKVA